MFTRFHRPIAGLRVLAATVCTLLVLGGIGHAQTNPPGAQATAQSGDQVTVPFSDPSRPGTVRVRLISGSITVRPATGRDVIVSTTRSEREIEREREREQQRSPDDQAAGLRRLTQPVGLSVEEEDNTITVSLRTTSGRPNVTLQVPPATSLVLRTVNGGEVTVEGVNGRIEVNNVNGGIRLTDVGGGVIANTVNGRLVATLRQVPANTPMSFTSFNGSVDVTLPGAARANLRLRSDRGDVYTDFELAAQRPPSGSGSSSSSSSSSSQTDNQRSSSSRDRDTDRPRYRMDVDRSIYGTINGGGAEFELRTFNGNVYLRRAK